MWQRRDLLEGLMRALVVSGQQQLRSQDQYSLADIVWPIAKYDVVIRNIHLIILNTIFSILHYYLIDRWPMTLTDAKTSGSFACRRWKSFRSRPNAMEVTTWEELVTNCIRTSVRKPVVLKVTKTGNTVDSQTSQIKFVIFEKEIFPEIIILCRKSSVPGEKCISVWSSAYNIP